VLLHWGGAIVILGMIVVLAAAYLIMGRLRITAGRSGQKVLRFNDRLDPCSALRSGISPGLE
jgi:hypothetical protein